MKTALLVSKVDEAFYVMEGRFGFEETTLIEMKAGEPVELPEDLVDDRLLVNKNKYSKLSNGEVPKTKDVKQDEPKKEKALEFDPVEFLNENHPLTELVLEELEEKQLFSISSALEIKVPYNIGKDKHIARILAKTSEE